MVKALPCLPLWDCPGMPLAHSKHHLGSRYVMGCDTLQHQHCHTSKLWGGRTNKSHPLCGTSTPGSCCLPLPDLSGLTIAPESRLTLIRLQPQACIRCVTHHIRQQVDMSRDGERADEATGDHGQAEGWNLKESTCSQKDKILTVMGS